MLIKAQSRNFERIEKNHVRRRGALAVGGAVGVDDPASLTRERGEYVVHVGTRWQGEISVLAESGEHAAGDGSTVSLAELGALLLLLPLLILIATGIGGDWRRRKALWTVGLRVGFRVGIRVS